MVDSRLLLKALMAKTGMPVDVTKGSYPSLQEELQPEEWPQPQDSQEPQDVDMEEFTNDDLAVVIE